MLSKYEAYELLTVALVIPLYYAVWFFFFKKNAFYEPFIEKEISADRFHALDGLRGFLSVSVFMHHLLCNYMLYTTDVWTLPPSRLGVILGQGGVAMFFMVTSFLFISKFLKRPEVFDSRRFFWSRICRTAPMYFISASLLILTMFYLTDFTLVVPPITMVTNIIQWLSFATLGEPDMNGLRNTGLINTVFWSLAYEWNFYLFFPLIVLFVRGWMMVPFVIFSCIIINLFSHSWIEYFFVAGGVAAAIGNAVPKCFFYSKKYFMNVIVLIGFLACYKLLDGIYSAEGALLFFIPFALVSYGTSIFGILTSRFARFLGTISYSVYLMHNYIIFVVFKYISGYYNFHHASILILIVTTTFCAILVVLISALTYRFIEYPILKLPLPVWMGGRADLRGHAADESMSVQLGS